MLAAAGDRPPSKKSRVAASHDTPPLALPMMRAAILTTSPMTVYSARLVFPVRREKGLVQGGENRAGMQEAAVTVGQRIQPHHK